MSQISGFSVRDVCRLPVLAIAVAAFLLGTHPALAQDTAAAASGSSGPLDLVKTSVTQVMAIVQTQADDGHRRAEVRQVAATLFDFDEMARRTLGLHWPERSPQEQEEFVRLFTEFLERSYLTTIGNYRLATITVQGRDRRGLVGAGPFAFTADRRGCFPPASSRVAS